MPDIQAFYLLPEVELLAVQPGVTMPSSTRLLRVTLLLGSVMTLTGIHREEPSLPVAWWLVRAVPLSILSIAVALSLKNVIMMQEAVEASLAICLGVGMVLFLMILLWFLWRRRPLHALLQQVARLECHNTHLCKHSNTSALRCMMLLFLAELVMLTAAWVTLLSLGSIQPADVLFPFWIASSLLGGAGFTLLLVFQALLMLLTQAEMVLFAFLVAGLAETASMQLRLVRRT